MSKLFLVTGCPRSGTTYVESVLQACHLKTRFEYIGRYEPAPTEVELKEAKRLGYVGFVDHFLVAHAEMFHPVVHLVRHPLNVISSLQLKDGWLKAEPLIISKFGLSFWRPLIEHQLYNSMVFYYYWNLVAEQNAAMTVCVENLVEELPKILDLIGDTSSEQELVTINRFTDHCNTRRDEEEYRQLTWDDLKETSLVYFAMIQKMARRYGY